MVTGVVKWGPNRGSARRAASPPPADAGPGIIADLMRADISPSALKLTLGLKIVFLPSCRAAIEINKTCAKHCFQGRSRALSNWRSAETSGAAQKCHR